MRLDASRRSLVSVVIPCYNKAAYVRETLTSVLRQTYRAIEVLVIDDGSTDGSWDVVRSFGDRILCERTENHGACHARNLGASKARGRYLMFLDADDFLSQHALRGLVMALESSPESSVAICPWSSWIPQGEGWIEAEAPFDLCPPTGDPLHAWLGGWYVPPCSILWPARLFGRVGGWDEALTANQDGDLMMRALVGGVGIERADEGRAFYRQVAGGPSVSQADNRDMLVSKLRVLSKVEDRLTAQGRLSEYRVSLGRAYHRVLSAYYCRDPALARRYVRHKRALAGRESIDGPLLHRLVCHLVGLERKEEAKAVFQRLGHLAQRTVGAGSRRHLSR